MTLATQNQAGIVRYETLHGEVALNVGYVTRYFCPDATKEEAFAFIQLCKFHRLNPFLREAYLIKYNKSETAQFVIGYQSWTQRADQDSRYKGFEAGLILGKEDGTLERRKGTFYGGKETLLGGWCVVFHEGRREPVEIELALGEYIQRTRDGQPNRFWKEKPGTMIRKCAIAQAHREAFPALFGGLYDQAEVGPDVELPEDAVIIEGTAVDVTQGELLGNQPTVADLHARREALQFDEGALREYLVREFGNNDYNLLTPERIQMAIGWMEQGGDEPAIFAADGSEV